MRRFICLLVIVMLVGVPGMNRGDDLLESLVPLPKGVLDQDIDIFCTDLLGKDRIRQNQDLLFSCYYKMRLGEGGMRGFLEKNNLDGKTTSELEESKNGRLYLECSEKWDQNYYAVLACLADSLIEDPPTGWSRPNEGEGESYSCCSLNYRGGDDTQIHVQLYGWPDAEIEPYGYIGGVLAVNARVKCDSMILRLDDERTINLEECLEQTHYSFSEEREVSRVSTGLTGNTGLNLNQLKAVAKSKKAELILQREDGDYAIIDVDLERFSKLFHQLRETCL